MMLQRASLRDDSIRDESEHALLPCLAFLVEGLVEARRGAAALDE